VASSRKTGRGRTPPPPKQHGSKDRIPHGRTVRASVKAIIEEVVKDKRKTVRASLMRGLRSSPRDAHHYLKLAAEYTDGKPDANLTVKFDEDELATARDTLSKKLDAILLRLTKPPEE